MPVQPAADHRGTLARRAPLLKFSVAFTLILGILFTAELTPPVQRLVVLPWTAALAQISAGLVMVFDPQVAAFGKLLQSNVTGFSVSIEAGCNGIEAAIILIAAMLAFPAPWRHTVIGIVAGLLAVQAVNVVRVISLFYLGQWDMRIFTWAHLYLWQALIMLDVLIVWLIWIRTLPRFGRDITCIGMCCWHQAAIMTHAAPSLGRFVLRIFLWLPGSFALWYWTAPMHSRLIGEMARQLVDLFGFGLISALEQQGSQLMFVTHLKVFPLPGQAAVLVPEVNPLIYSYGLALFLALMLGSRAAWWKLLAGAGLLLLPQAWGVAFDFLAQVGIKLGPDVSLQTGLSQWRLEVIVLCYQLGFLIFPCLIPMVLWAMFCGHQLEELTRPAPTVAALGAQGRAEYNNALPKQECTHESQRLAQQSHVQVGRPPAP